MKNQHLDVEQDALKLLQRSAERQLSLRKLSHSLSFKIAFTTSLLGLYTWITVISPYATNGMPTGWDTGAYLAWTNSFRIAGFEYVLSPQFFQFALALSLHLEQNPSKPAAVGLLVSTALMLFTDVEVGGFGIIALLTSIVASWPRMETHPPLRRVALPIIGGLSAGSILWLPYLPDYLRVS